MEFWGLFSGAKRPRTPIPDRGTQRVSQPRRRRSACTHDMQQYSRYRPNRMVISGTVSTHVTMNGAPQWNRSDRRVYGSVSSKWCFLAFWPCHAPTSCNPTRGNDYNTPKMDRRAQISHLYQKRSSENHGPDNQDSILVEH